MSQKAWIEFVGDRVIIQFDPHVSSRAREMLIDEIGIKLSDMILGAAANDETICKANAVIDQAWNYLVSRRDIYFRCHHWMAREFEYLEP